MATMKAVAFRGPGTLAIEERPKPVPRAGQAVIRITTTTICGTDVHIVKGEYPVRPGLVLGHEPVGVIDALGDGLEPEYHVGQRVLVGAITPCGQCFYCLNANALAVRRSRSAAGSSATRSTARGRSTCSCPMPAPTWRRFRTRSPTRRSCCWPTSSRPASAAPRAAT